MASKAKKTPGFPGEHCMHCGHRGLSEATGGFAEQGRYTGSGYEHEGGTYGRHCPACDRTFQVFTGKLLARKPKGRPKKDAPYCFACGTRTTVPVGTAFVEMGPYDGKEYDKEGDATHHGCVSCGRGALDFPDCPKCPKCGSRHAVTDEREEGYECVSCGAAYGVSRG